MGIKVRLMKIITTSAVALTMLLSPVVLTMQPAMATSGNVSSTMSPISQFGIETAILSECGEKVNPDGEDDGSAIFCVLNIVLNVLTYGVGIAGTLGIIISGVQYLTARDNEQQVTKAKSRIINIVIGLAVYAVMWGFLQWILPGGVFRGSTN